MKLTRKYKIRNLAFVLFIILFSSFFYVACEDINELPPRTDSSSGKTYKMPDPVLLNAAEIAIVDQIREEYRNNTTN